MKLDPQGSFVWARLLPMNETGGLAIDAIGNVVFAGGFPVEWYSGLLVGKMRADGELLWTRKFWPDETNPGDAAVSVRAGSNGAVYVVGRLGAPTDFGNSVSGPGAFVARLGP